MTAELAIFLVIGLLGGAHCIGMCGPLVTVYAGRLNEQAPTRDGVLSPFEVRQLALFNVGRTVSYAAIGALFGLVGGTLYATTEAVTPLASTVRGSVGVVVGLFVIAIGLHYLAGRTGEIGIPGPDLGFDRVQATLLTHVDRLVGGPGIVALGAVHGLLPCPILYPAFLYAFATGSAVTGAIALGLLGIGTFLPVFLYGTVVESVDPVRRQRVHRALGAAFVVLGYVLLAHGLMPLGVHVPHPQLPSYQPLEGIAGGH